ncbi:glycosyltransferase family 39 protein [bacterium]|nr:glycosyltransferase family 39 protein [bacterium]
MKRRKSKAVHTVHPSRNATVAPSELPGGADRSIFPVVFVAGAYTVVMLVLSLTYHRIGGYEVETDFYADFAFNTKKLLAGDISLDNFGFKGPLYYILLALFRLMFGEYFRAGLILNVLAAGGSIWVMLLVMRRLFGTREAVLTTIFTISTFAFLLYTFSVGTDMVSVLFSFLAVYFLLARERSTASLVLAGLFACLAYLTRNNTVFLYPAGLLSIILMDFRGKGIKTTGKNAGLFMGSSILFGLPWYIPNWILKGTPIDRSGLYVLKLQYTHIPKEQLETVNSFTGLIRLDPLFFFKNTGINAYTYFIQDIRELIGLPFGILIIAGAAVLVVLLIKKRLCFTGAQWAFFSFPLFHFAALALIHYNIRFAFFRIPFYAILLFVPLMYLIKRADKRQGRFRKSSVLFAVALVLVILKFYQGYLDIKTHYSVVHDPVEIFGAARIVKAYNFDSSCGIIARRPHLCYYSGLRFIMFPTNLEYFEDLFEFAYNEKARFFWVDDLVVRTCPTIKFMVEKIQKYPGYTPVFACPYGVLYLIDNVN